MGDPLALGYTTLDALSGTCGLVAIVSQVLELVRQLTQAVTCGCLSHKRLAFSGRVFDDDQRHCR
ncbi:hypothetical protein ACNJI5_21060, partial [Mycobacterium tuberculosis]